MERKNPLMNNNTHSTKNIHQNNLSSFQNPCFTQTMNSNTFNKDNRRKENNIHTNQIGRTKTGPKKIIITNQVDISPSAL